MSLEDLGWTPERRHAFEPYARDGLLPGRIISEHRSHVEVAISGNTVTAEVAGRMWNEVDVRSDIPGVGDFVALSPSAGDGPAIVEARLPRTSALIRQAAGERRPQLIAANVDIVMIVTALDGEFSTERVERYIALVRDGGAEPVVIINKCDIASNQNAALGALDEIAPNVSRHVISAHRSSDVARLEPYFEGGRTVALVGSSGVGKSTLTNQLLKRNAQITGTVSAHDNRGRHTTTHRELFARPGGGVIMDTPGMGGLVLWDDSESDSDPEDEFTDIEELAAACKFRNCSHDHEPACAVRAAIESGDLTQERLEQYRYGKS